MRTVNPLPETRDSAYDVLAGFSNIVSFHRLVHGHYVAAGVDDESFVHNVCQGHRACSVGACAISYEGDPDRARKISYPESRRRTFRERPGLLLAYYALNAAANEQLLDEREKTYGPFEHAERAYMGALEYLFEVVYVTDHGAEENDDGDGELATRQTERALLNVIGRARELIALDEVPNYESAAV